VQQSRKQKQNDSSLYSLPSAASASVEPSLDNVLFEAGQIFSKYNKTNNGSIDKLEFERMVRDYPQLLSIAHKPPSSSAPPGSTGDTECAVHLEPGEVVTGSTLTHYDETAGVAIPHNAVSSHRNMGNTVAPLQESYHIRYDRLRALVTGRLLPRRETLLQLRRQLQHISSEVEASRKAIERETMSDAEQIVERLRTAESMRQSSIKHQVIQLEEELQGIERLVRRVEQANDGAVFGGVSAANSGVLLTSAAPGAVPIEAFRGPRAALMVELIQQFSDLTSQIERLSSKPLSVQTEFPIDDFPKETTERLEIIARCDRYAHALSVKDHMLWTALQEKDRTLEQLDEERKLSHDYAKEVAQWAELAQTLKSKLDSETKARIDMENQNKDLQNILRDHNIFYVPALK